MLDAIRRLLAAPTFADEEETRVAAILHTMLLGCAGISLVALVIQLVALEQTQAALLIYPAALACSLGLLTLVRRGLLQLAGSIFLLFLWAAITFGALTYGGIRSPSAGGHILVVIIATLLFSGRLVLMFVAGHETTTNLIGNGLISLLRNRDQMQMLRSDPTYGHGAVEEMLRYESSVQLDARTALEDADIAGHHIDARPAECGLRRPGQ
mgnify:CR=1 FL=1